MKYNKEMLIFIKKNVTGRTNAELVNLVNAEFGKIMTESQMRAYKKNHGLKSGLKKGRKKGLPTKLFPENIQKYILSNYRGAGPKEMTERLNEKFGKSYTRQQIKTYYTTHKLDSGLKGFYEKGHESWNKGKHTPGGPPHTLFKKGRICDNKLPVGSEVMRSDGYPYVKIGEPNIWKTKHRIVWEEVNGEVPEGHCLLFLNKNRGDTDINNLKLISRSQLSVLNCKGLLTTDKTINELAVKTVSLILKTSEAKKTIK